MKFQRDVDAAYDRWLALGSKNEVEGALAVLEAAGLPLPPTRHVCD
jgi:hypothetical protein